MDKAETGPLYDMLVHAQEAIQADRCTLYRVDVGRDEVVSLIALGLEIPEIRLSLKRGLVGYVARTGRGLNLKDVYNDPRFDRSVDQQTGYRTRSALTLPIRDADNRIVGVLQALNKKSGHFGKDDEQILERFCGEIAGHIEN